MWTRKELKEQAKAALKRNYWKAVLVTTLVMALVGSTGGAVGGGVTLIGSGAEGGSFLWTYVFNYLHDYLPALLTVILIISVVAVLVALAVIILLVNPIEVGFTAFRMNALRDKGNVGDLGRGFDVSYKRNVGTLFMMVLYTFLWSLLLVVPGIIKAYEYSMIPYLLVDHPEMTRKEAFAASKAMMKGNKWKAFVLDLSFILWSMLGALTLGIVTVFYVEPYRQLTGAALYEKLKTLNETPAAETSAQNA